MPKKKKIIILILAVLTTGGIFAYLTLVVEKKVTTPEAVGKCSRGTVTKLVINTDKRPAFIKDWIYCFREECVPADEFLEECNNKYVSLKGKLIVGEICPSCYPDPCGCVVTADIFGVTLHQIDDDIKKRYEDVKVYIEGILHWKGPSYGPTLDVTKIEKVYF